MADIARRTGKHQKDPFTELSENLPGMELANDVSGDQEDTSLYVKVWIV